MKLERKTMEPHCKDCIYDSETSDKKCSHPEANEKEFWKKLIEDCFMPK